MRQLIAEYLPWLMSAITITAIELQGRKWPRAWVLSLGGQVFWFAWIAASQQWGFLPMTAILSIQYARNHLRWLREARVVPQAFDVPLLTKHCGSCVNRVACKRAGACYIRTIYGDRPSGS